MGLIWSYLPSIERNTLCCVDVRSRKSVCYTEPKPVYHPYSAPSNVVKKNLDDPDKNIPANEVEWDALIGVVAPTEPWNIFDPDNDIQQNK